MAERVEELAMSAQATTVLGGGPRLIVDCSQPWNGDTPPFPLDDSPVVQWVKRFPSHGTNHQKISTQLHIGTHIDAPLHWREDGMDIASIPLDRLCGRVVVADLSDILEDFGVLRSEDVESRVNVLPGDILLIHTGYHRYYNGGPEPDLIRYFCKHPGGDEDFADWLVERQIRWLGVDMSGPDHPMNSNSRHHWQLVWDEANEIMGDVNSRFPLKGQTIIHRKLFANNIPIVENLSGDIIQLKDKDAFIMAFPWKFAGGEAAFVRVVAFVNA
jgi:arylformamidase